MDQRNVLNRHSVFLVRLLWGAIIFVGLYWVIARDLKMLGILPLSMDGVTAAAWLQALGALLAILGAAAFPHMHEAIKQRKRDDRIRAVMELLTHNQVVALDRLRRALWEAVVTQHTSITDYQDEGWTLKWEPHIEALRAIPMADLNYKQVDMLGELKVVAAYAQQITQQLGDWDGLSDRAQSVISRLELYHARCKDFLDYLSADPCY